MCSDMNLLYRSGGWLDDSGSVSVICYNVKRNYGFPCNVMWTVSLSKGIMGLF